MAKRATLSSRATCCCGGGSTPMRQGVGVRPAVLRLGWPVDSTSFTPRQSSPVACATSAWRSMRSLRVVVSSSAR